MKKQRNNKKIKLRAVKRNTDHKLSAKNLFQHIKNHKLKSLIVIVLVLLIANWTYNRIQIYTDKKKFNEAELAILNLGEKIKQDIGSYDEVKRYNSCSYASRKFSKGPLSCVVSLNFLYTNKPVDSANHIVKKISKIIGTDIRSQLLRSSSVFISKNLENGDQRLNQDINIQSEKRCSIEYTYGIEESYLELFRPSSDQDLEVTLYCSGPAKAEHYPLR